MQQFQLCLGTVLSDALYSLYKDILRLLHHVHVHLDVVLFGGQSALQCYLHCLVLVSLNV